MKLEWRKLHLKAANPFRTARAVRTERTTLWVKVRHDGVEGWGEAVPMDTYGQTVESAERVLSSLGDLSGASPFEIEKITADLCNAYDGQRATVCAIDAALHDWVGKKLGVPVHRLLGLSSGPLPKTSYSLGIEEDESLLIERVRAARDFPILKVKLGSDRDLDMLTVIRRHASDAVLRVDANMGWTPDQALDLLPRLAALGVELVEQPLPATDLKGLRRLKEAAILPIVADESCVRPRDVPRVAGCVDGINIKLSKCGGIRPALAMIRLARALGLRVMLGCMIESSLGISAALQLASLADWLDLDGHLLLAEDLFEGIGGARGALVLNDQPGLGMACRESRPAR